VPKGGVAPPQHELQGSQFSAVLFADEWQEVVTVLQSGVGEVINYNGGMVSQMERARFL
jgi:hypothetical protein